MKVGDIVKLTNEGWSYLFCEVWGKLRDGEKRIKTGIVVKKYIYDDGDAWSNGQWVYDVFIGGQVSTSLFDTEIALVK